MIAIILALLFGLSAYGQIVIVPKNKSTMVHPGDVAEAEILVPKELRDPSLSPVSFKANNDVKKIIIMSVSPFVGTSQFNISKAKIVFGPEFNPDSKYNLTTKNANYEIAFSGWLWNPQVNELTREFAYEQMPMFSTAWWRKNGEIISILTITALAILGWLGRRILLKKKEKKRQEKIKSDWIFKIQMAQDMKSFEEIWRSRDDLKGLFPESSDSQKEFFAALNKIQFKPLIAKSEVEAIVEEKNKLLVRMTEAHRGV